MAALLSSMEMIHSLWVMISVSAKTGGSTEIMAGQGTWLQWRWVLGCDGDGHLVAMEMGAWL